MQGVAIDVPREAENKAETQMRPLLKYLDYCQQVKKKVVKHVRTKMERLMKEESSIMRVPHGYVTREICMQVL